PGFVAKVHVDLGDLVTDGQPLADIAIPELDKESKQKKAMVDFASAEWQQARASVEVSASQIASADAMVVEAKAALGRVHADFERWESELKRITALVAGKVIDEQTLDETRKQFRTAVALKAEA